MENDAVREYIAHNAPEIQEQFDLVLNTISMEETFEQAEQGCDAATATLPKTTISTGGGEDDAS